MDKKIWELITHEWGSGTLGNLGKGTIKEGACSLPSAGDCSNIILGVPRSNHKEQGKFKDNIIK